MKIGLIVPGFSDGETDWCIPALLNTVRILSHDHDVHVFSLRYPHKRASYPVFGATVHAFGGGTDAGWRRVSLVWRAVAGVMRSHRQTPFDILHGLWADEPGFVAVAAGRMLGVPSVVSLMGGEFVHLAEIGYGHQHSRSARVMIQASTGAAQRVTVGSQTLHVLAQKRIHPQKLRITPLGIDSAMFSPGEPAPLTGQYRLLHVASLVPIKNQALMLEAFALVLLKLPKAHLHIVGEGVLLDALRQQAATLGVSGEVTFHGAVEHHHLPEFYQSADLCLLTSYYESQSMVALEAAACGKITLGTNVGLMADLLPENWLVEADHHPKPAETIAANIIHLLQDTQLRSSLEQQAYARILARYTLAKTVQAWVDLYHELAHP